MNVPSTNGSNGRGAGGRFAVGNAGGPGNPHGRRVAQLRAALLDAVTDDDLQAIVAKLVEMAKGGDLRAMKEVLDRTLGKPPAALAVEIGVACDSCPQMMTPEQRRAKLVDLAERLGVKDKFDASSEIRQEHRQLLSEPDYLEFQRQRALEADAG